MKCGVNERGKMNADRCSIKRLGSLGLIKELNKIDWVKEGCVGGCDEKSTECRKSNKE